MDDSVYCLNLDHVTWYWWTDGVNACQSAIYYSGKEMHYTVSIHEMIDSIYTFARTEPTYMSQEGFRV